jgi:hypothetical protein
VLAGEGQLGVGDALALGRMDGGRLEAERVAQEGDRCAGSR